MKIAIMQPYIFPYIGYFQLVKAVDLFIFYNDVNFIKRGWINRNRILLNNQDFLITIPCVKPSQNRLICETKLAFDLREKSKFLATLNQAYRGAPFFKVTFDLVEKIINKEHEYIDDLAMDSVKQVSDFLNLETRFEESEGRYGNHELKRADRLIDICQVEKILDYVNPIGGQEIYEKTFFASKGVNLNFLKPVIDTYPQYSENFVPGLSIIDVLMFNDKQVISNYLSNYELV